MGGGSDDVRRMSVPCRIGAGAGPVDEGAKRAFPLMPVGEACDMGHGRRGCWATRSWGCRASSTAAAAIGYGRHLSGKALDRRLGIIKRLAAEMIGQWFDGTAPQGSLVHHDDGGGFSVELGKGFANEFPIRVVCQVLGFPDEARSQFVYWYSSMMNGLGGSERRTRASLPARIWRTSSKAWWTNDPSARPCCSTTTVNPSVPTSSRSSAPAGLTATCCPPRRSPPTSPSSWAAGERPPEGPA